VEEGGDDEKGGSDGCGGDSGHVIKLFFFGDMKEMSETLWIYK
jgi:hypothetical protein